jgi:hypothetical protein
MRLSLARPTRSARDSFIYIRNREIVTSMSTTNPVITLALAELRKRGITVTSTTTSAGVAVLVLNLDSVPVTPRAAVCGRCGEAIPPHTGPGRPRQRCAACAHPLGIREYRRELARAAWKAPPVGTVAYGEYMAAVYQRLGGQRGA